MFAGRSIGAPPGPLNGIGVALTTGAMVGAAVGEADGEVEGAGEAVICDIVEAVKWVLNVPVPVT
jgi:hypothetical protein